MTAHAKKHNRDITGYRVIFATKNKKIAHLVETLFHMVGFNGFRY